MEHAEAVDLLGNGRETSCDRRAVNLREVHFGRRWVVWLSLLVALIFLIIIAEVFLSAIYVFMSANFRTGNPSKVPIPDSALNKELPALQLSPWHKSGVGAKGVCNTSECINAASHLLFGMNRAGKPCDDFYDFVCGNWVKLYRDKGLVYNSPIHEMRISEMALVKEILMTPPDSYELQPLKSAGNFFHQCIGEDNVKPVVELTTKLGGWPSLEGESWNEDGFDLVTALAFIRRKYLMPILVGVQMAPYGANETVYVIKLSVPKFISEHKLNNGSNIQTAFRSLYKKILSELTGVPDWSGQRVQDADEIFELEKVLAQAATVPVENANDSSTQRAFTVAEFQEILDGSPNGLNNPVSNNSISWQRLLNEIFNTSGVQIKDDQVIIVTDLGYFREMAQILGATPKRTIGNYILSALALRLLSKASSKMQRVIEEFSVQIGQPLGLQSREKYCFGYTMVFFGIPIMHQYLKTKLDLEARSAVEEMAGNLQATFDELLVKNHWLSHAAKLTAQKKLRALKTFIGYPNWLLNSTEIESRFEGLHLESNFIETLGNVMQWTNDKIFRQLGQSPQDLDEPWFTLRRHVKSFTVFNQLSLVLPSEVQGYYFVGQNYIVIPMGFIQPPNFYNNVPIYVNYGKTGAAIGHEIIHGFDANVKHLDEHGQFNDQSLTEEDKQNYEEKSNCFRDQYNKFEIFPGVYLNGSGGLDENIADNDGLKLAYLAYKQQYSRSGNDHRSLPGFEKLSADQLFFLSYGSLWCEHGNEAIQRLLVRVDPHSPGKYRINGALQNSAEFADAWNCPVGAPMNPIKKCTWW